MISAAAICPHPLLLLPELAGRQAEVGRLRAACLAVVGDLRAASEVVVVVAGRDVPAPTSHAPIGWRVADRLLADAGWDGPVEHVAVGFDTPPPTCERVGRRLQADLCARPKRVGLLVMADGSARRGPKAPGHFDPRAHDLDELFSRAVQDGDLRRLARVQPALAKELWFAGRAALQVLAALVPDPAGDGLRPRVTVAYEDDPFGVMYLAALWRFGAS